MYMARLLIVFLLIVAALVAYSPQTHESMSGAWEGVRPMVIALMDGMYATVRMMIVGDGSEDRIHDDPGAPVDFDRIVTMNSAHPL
jgi:hypothetical protein